MENSTEEHQEEVKANAEINEEAELKEEKTHNTLKGAINGVSEGATNGEEKLQNGDRGGGGGGGGGEDLSSINAMMSAVMAAAGSINGGGGDGGGGVPSANSSAGPSPSPSPSKSLTGAMRAPPSRNARRNQDTKDDGSTHICPLCDKSCQTQHQLTMHIRQHNADTGATDHSCSICGKCLSSASSLDRHMLVHSGERPYKCNICGQTFTTNGNMHRHMKIHEKDPTNGILPVSSPPSPNKRRRPSVKRRQGPEEENGEEPPNKKVTEDAAAEDALAIQGSEEELLTCPICFKTCSSRLDLDAHMDTHPDTALRCDFCCLSFRTHRGLLRHNAAVHKLLPQDPSGRPFIQNNPSIPTGFNDLAFIDFSCQKFARIAQVWCETNLRRCISKFHRFVCDCCDKAFPLRSALDLHKTTSHPDKATASDSVEAEETPTEGGDGCENSAAEHEDAESEVLGSEQAGFLETLGLQHVSTVKSGPTDDEIHQAHLDSIKVIHVEPPTFSLPQEPASGYLSGGLGLTLGLGMGGLAALSIPLLEASASTLQGLSQREALSLLSLQPFQTGFLLQPDGGAATGSAASSGVKPGEAGGTGIMELADIHQILKVASAAPNQLGLPPLAKAPGFTGTLGQAQAQKAMPPLKPKPPISPRSSLTATTPPPLQSSQQASLGCISPSLPPPTPTLFKTPSSSSSAGSGGQMDADCMGDAHTPLSDSPPAATTAIHEEAGLSGRKLGAKVGNNAAKGSFPCRFCDQVFSFSGVLQAHMRFHLGILPHQCNICDYVAPDKATLIRHLRTHSGERPYVCRVCHYPFTVKANCERHLRKKHAKTSRKDIEKNIKYVTSTATANLAAPITATTTPQDTETGCAGAETTCRFCGEDLKTYRALQIHLRTHNGCQKKPFECKRCGAAFLAKRNCIHHLLKQHPEVQEREIEEHIATLQPAASVVASRTAPVNTMLLNGISQPPIQVLQAVKVEDLASVGYPVELDQPLDFSSKGRGAGSQAGSPGVKLESAALNFDCSALDQPIDLSIPTKRQRREPASAVEKREIKTEQSGGSIVEQQLALEKIASALPPLHSHPQLGCYQLPPGSTPPSSSSLPSSARAQRLKPLLPKPTTSSPPSATLKELPPLASIAQIISSVSSAQDLLKREAASLESKPPPGVASSQADSAADAPGPSTVPDAQSEDASEGTSRKRSRKKLAAKEKVASSGGGIDLESSGEFASVEKMLATTDANKFSTYLQTGAADLAGKRDVNRGEGEQKEGGEKEDGKPAGQVAALMVPQQKGKKNAYSNSVQKMTCPFCPRVFPWASSLQRHMLTHTGQKPFPCPRCDAFFSTKSNCERHLLRKHGVTHRTLRRNGAIMKKDGEEGVHESAESQSETEQVAAEASDLSGATDSGHASFVDNPAPSDSTQTSPAQKESQGCSPADAEQQDSEPGEQPDQQEAPQASAAPGKQPPQSSKVESTDEDDCHSNKSLDLNFGKKLIDFKLSTSSSASAPQEEQPLSSSSSSSSLSTPSTSTPQEATESPEEKKTASSSSVSSPSAKPQPEHKHACRVCKKNFRFATTLARHERAHTSEDTAASTEEASPTKEEEAMESKAGEEERDEMDVEEGGAKLGESEEERETGESEEEEKEKEERSDEEASEPKSVEGGETAGRVDKRKKICNVCGKRFWSLQDLTRHMRSHTGERPYQCQTCERTFTLKHSLVRHQRIHLKPRGADGSSAANDDAASEDGDSCTPTPTSTCPPSENESECGSATAGGKELEEEDAKEEGESQPEDSASTAEEENAAKRSDSDPPAASEDIKDKSELSGDSTASQPSSDGTHQATESKTSDDSKAEPDDSTSVPGEAPPTGGFIQGLLEIHAQPPLEHILPNGEPPLVGVD